MSSSFGCQLRRALLFSVDEIDAVSWTVLDLPAFHVFTLFFFEVQTSVRFPVDLRSILAGFRMKEWTKLEWETSSWIHLKLKWIAMNCNALHLGAVRIIGSVFLASHEAADSWNCCRFSQTHGLQLGNLVAGCLSIFILYFFATLIFSSRFSTVSSKKYICCTEHLGLVWQL